MKFAGVLKSVNQIAHDTGRLVAGHHTFKCRRLILAIGAGKRGADLPAIRPGTNAAEWGGDSDSRLQTIPAEPTLIQVLAAGNAERRITEINHRLIKRVETGLHQGTVAKPATRAKEGWQWSHTRR